MSKIQELTFLKNKKYLNIQSSNLPSDVVKKLQDIIDSLDDEYKVIEWDKFKDFKGDTLKENTLKTYQRYGNKIKEHFDDEDIVKIIKEQTDELIEWIENMDGSDETKKQYYKSIISICRNLKFESLLNKFQNILLSYRNKIEKELDEKKEMDENEIDESMKIIKKTYKELLKTIDSEDINNYTLKYKQLLLLKFIIDYGVLRLNEFKTIWIMTDDDNDYDNYFNISKNN